MPSRSNSYEEFAAKMSRRADALTLICLRAQNVVDRWQYDRENHDSHNITFLPTLDEAITQLAAALLAYKRT